MGNLCQNSRGVEEKKPSESARESDKTPQQKKYPYNWPVGAEQVGYGLGVSELERRYKEAERLYREAQTMPELQRVDELCGEMQTLCLNLKYH